jgi:TPR repeat protein
VAHLILGNMYHHGMCVANDAVGIPIDSTEAAGLYRFAVGQGLANAQFNLGLMYELGEGML